MAGVVKQRTERPPFKVKKYRKNGKKPEKKRTQTSLGKPGTTPKKQVPPPSVSGNGIRRKN